MFPNPSHNKDNKPLLINIANSPSDNHARNRSTLLPYFKRFPNSKFFSQ